MLTCPRCKGSIPDGLVVCPNCGKKIQIVPDYNPLDDVLAKEIGGAGVSREKRRERDRARSDKNAELARQRRRRKEMIARKKKQRKILLSLLFVLVLLIAALVFMVWRSSYSGLVHRGTSAYNKGNYSEAESLLKTAIEKKPSAADAYKAIYKVYIAEDEADTAEQLMLGAIDDYPDEVDLYKALFSFYIDQDDTAQIAYVLKDIEDDDVRSDLSEYDTARPQSSLDEGEYDDVQQASLSADKGCKIYYTTDGSNPTKDSKKYINPIQISEGETALKAIAVNKKGIESLPITFKYSVVLPVADAPAVTPSTGQYYSAQKIEVQVPDGYTAYYTLDGSEPDDSSTLYEEPFDMPTGNTIVSVVLVSKDGKLSDVTTRNYELN